MNPAFSVVFLTTASGAGYGMLAWLGLLDALALVPRSGWFGVPAVAFALALTIAGLLASTFHLGRPERAWRAISQWRTSWLSREGVMAIVTFAPAGGFALAWGLVGGAAAATVGLGLLAAVCGLLTVFSQGMIYATLKPIRQWHRASVPVNFLLLALFSGAACTAAAAALHDGAGAQAAGAIAAVGGIAALAGKLLYWHRIDGAAPVATIASATGLGALGTVRSLELPHTEENYLLREMGFRIGRKHAARLRRIAVSLGFTVPILLLLAGALGVATVLLLPLASLACLAGIYIERWLFFAEATHTVTLYYGRAA